MNKNSGTKSNEKHSPLEAISLHDFIQSHAIKTETGVPLNFERYYFMHQVYSDDSPLLVCMKAAQIGFSTYEILKTSYEAYYYNMDMIYVLPTMDDVVKFSGGKTNRILANNPVMQKWTKDKDSVQQKRFGRATIYYQGSYTERAALMITAKKLVVDEYDRCKQDIVEQYDSRLQATPDAHKAYFSNPSIPDFGVHKYYQISDQMKWHITHSCGKQYVMDEGCIDYVQEKFICPHCKREITDYERTYGEWLPTSSGEWRGYWIPLWIAPWMKAHHIARYKREKSPEYFANFVAGLPYYGSGNKPTVELFTRCMIQTEGMFLINSQEERVIIGVDTGLPIHIVCGNKDGIFYYGTLSDPSIRDPYEELEFLLRRWPNSIIVSDQGGDLIGIRRLKERYPGRVFLVWYRGDRKADSMISWGAGDEYGRVIVDRNRMIQMVLDYFQDKRIVLNAPAVGLKQKEMEAEWHDYIVHWLNMYRVWEKDDSGQVDKMRGFEWKRSGPDHYAHATVYWAVGMDKFSQSKAGIVDFNVKEVIPTGYLAKNDGIILSSQMFTGF